MRYAILLIALIFNLIQINTQWVVDDDKCQTPNSGLGFCINISTCQPIIDLLTTSSKPLSQDTRDLLVSYRCGSHVSPMKVCCPIAPTATTKRPNNLIALPNVANHRNINLLKKSCGIVPTSDRFSGGNDANLFEFPWMVLISYKIGNAIEFRCEGTLINDRYVLTAAHCITNLGRLVLAGVRLGEFDISKQLDCETDSLGAICTEPVQDLSIEEVIPHEKYNITSFSNDIGLLRLGRKANITESVNPICLPITPEVPLLPKTIVTGWGRTENASKSNILLSSIIPIIPQSQCQKSYDKIATITSNQICAGGENQDSSCVGDGGSPILFIGLMDYEPRYIQSGVVSFGPKPCGLNGRPGVYTKITAYLDWILDNLKP